MKWWEGMTLEGAQVVLRRRMVRWALHEENGHIGKAAARLGVHRNTLTRYMPKRLGIRFRVEGTTPSLLPVKDATNPSVSVDGKDTKLLQKL